MKEQILALYEIEGCPPALIATTLEMDEAIVCAVLAAESAIYRSQVQKSAGGDPLVSDQVFAKAADAYIGLAFATGNEFIKEKALRFLINEKKGRNDAKSGITINNTLVELNQRLVAIARGRQEKPVEEVEVQVS